MINYKDEYKTYYENLKKKVKNVKVEEDKSSQPDTEITPKRMKEQVNYRGNYKSYGSGRDTYRYTANRGGYKYGSREKDDKKKFGYINKLILRIIVTFILILFIFIFKISPNENVKILHENFDEQINAQYDLTFAKDAFNKLGIDIEEVIDGIENKTTEVMKEILD